ncbi:MAG: hypothetical protein GF315_13190 [candidate division Zixibacteria bacterium]|nr:hypothetical protein [candidate division Zixibacteria bacterium]
MMRNLYSIPIAILLLFVACEKDRPQVRVLDGDTFIMDNGETVRLIGIDTPETGDEFASESTELLRQLLQIDDITFEYDQQKYDKYGRTLAYVYVDTYFVNKTLLDSGLACAYFHRPNLARFDELVQAQKQARASNINIWSAPVKSPCEYYLATKSSFRFHRPSCHSIKNRNISSLRKFANRDDALDIGLSPCRNCKP